MGFLGDLFSKKACAFCGDENRVFGNRKLKDGNMCTDCVAKLSPWFSDRKESTVEEIGAQLKYREENAKALEDFWPNPAIGKEHFFYAEMRGDVPMRFAVSHDINYRKDNADIIKFEDVVSCTLDIDDRYEELKYTNDKGERVSYNPPRYKYSYDFYVDMGIKNNPYFDEIRFKLNHFPVEVTTEADTRGFRMASHSNFDPSFNPEWREYKAMYDEIEALVSQSRMPPKATSSNTDSGFSPEYKEFFALFGQATTEQQKADLAMYKSLTDSAKVWPDGLQKDQLMQMANTYLEKAKASITSSAPTQSEPTQASASATPSVCPACNAPVSGKFCEFCGEKLG